MNKNRVIVDGITYCAYDITYQYRGKTYSFSIWATSQKDAEQRLSAIQNSSKVDGLIELSIDENILSKN